MRKAGGFLAPGFGGLGVDGESNVATHEQKGQRGRELEWEGRWQRPPQFFHL